ncbi:MAG TPA: hypothetical protein VGA86_10245 [Desulfatiglandales bacterium]|jgi:hypothetical protein
MEAIKIKTRLESETIRSPELRKLIGKRVEIIILEETEPNAVLPKRQPGSAKGEITVTNDFEKPLPKEIVQEFYR